MPYNAAAFNRMLFNDCVSGLRLLLAVIWGICASQLLALHSLSLRAPIGASLVLFKILIVAVFYPSFALGVGASVGILAQRWPALAAAISLAPWVVGLMIDAAERPQFAPWFKATLLMAAGLYIWFGIVAAEAAHSRFARLFSSIRR